MKYQFEQIINTYDCTPDGRISPIAPLNYFQEIAQRQTEFYNIGMDYLIQNHYAWVLVKYEVDFHHYPKAGEKVIIETEPTGINRFEAYRKFRMLSEEGEELVTGKSVWVLIDTQANKLLRINEIKEINDSLGIENPEILRVPRLQPLDSHDYERTFNVRYLDIDTNWHVNNVKFFAWALEILPLEVVRSNEIEKIKIYFKEQAFYGDTVLVKAKEVEPLKWRINIEKEDGSILCEIEIKGRPCE